MNAETSSMPLELVILVGLPGSGKSSFYANRFASTHAHVSKDAMPRSARKNRLQLQMIEQSLSDGRSVVVDNTNPSPEVRASLIEAGRKHGVRIIAYYLECSVKECLERNRRREIGRVPDVAIFVTLKKLKTPEIAEGFDEVHLVKT